MIEDDNKLLIIIIARKAAGKSEIGKYLSEEKGFYHIEGSSVFRRFIVNGDEVGFDTRNQYYNWLLLKHGYKLVEVEGVVPCLAKYNKIIFTGARTATGIKTLFQEAEEHNITIRLVWLETDRSIRYRNALMRNRDSNINVDNFDDSDLDEYSYYCLKYGELFSDIVIENNGTIFDLHKRIDSIDFLKKPRCDKEADQIYRVNSAISELDELILKNNVHSVFKKELGYIKNMLIEKYR